MKETKDELSKATSIPNLRAANMCPFKAQCMSAQLLFTKPLIHAFLFCLIYQKLIPVKPVRSIDQLFPTTPTANKINLKNTNDYSLPIPTLGPNGFNIVHNLQQHANAPLPTYRVNSPGINIAPTININVNQIAESFFEDEDEHSTDMPFIFDDFLKMLHDFGYIMLKDDRHDIYKFRYTKRRGYPPHFSRLHHWYIGAGLMTLAQVGGMISKMREFMEIGAGMNGLEEGGGEMMELMGGLEEIPEQPSQLPPLRIYGTPSLPVQANRPPIMLKKKTANIAMQPSLPQTIERQPMPTRQYQTKLTVPTAPRLH